MKESVRGGSETSRRRLPRSRPPACSGLVSPSSAAPGRARDRAAVRHAPALDLDRFIADCVAANRETEPQAAVFEVLARTVRDPAAVRAALGEPTEAGLRVLHRSRP